MLMVSRSRSGTGAARDGAGHERAAGRPRARPRCQTRSGRQEPSAEKARTSAWCPGPRLPRDGSRGSAPGWCWPAGSPRSRRSRRHGQPGAVVDVPEPAQRVGLAVVGAERRLVGAVGDDRRAPAPRGSGSPTPGAGTPTSPCGASPRPRPARCSRGLTRRRRRGRRPAPARHARAVAVDAQPAGDGHPGEHLLVAGDHAGEVHDLGHAECAVARDQLADVRRVERRPGGLERQRRARSSRRTRRR